jgi:N-acetylglucosaminyldiphosphoundecaprenol N-acetyl-beta-D-mannosaminyltransferase
MSKGIASFVNPYSMLILANNEPVAESIDYWYVDGISLVKAIEKYEQKNIGRFSFDDTSIAPLVFDFAKNNNKTVAIIGTKELIIQKAVMAIEKKFAISILYYRNGYFKNDFELQDCIDTISNKNIDIVICGMGTPYQEDFLIKLKKTRWDGYGFTCGGYLHQIATKENYYPVIFDKLNIRWMYRIIDEPKLLKRYFYCYPIFFAKYLNYILHKK